MGLGDRRDADAFSFDGREEPFVLALGLGIIGCGEFVEAIGNRKAAPGEFSSFRPKVEDGLAVRSRPAPAAND